MAMRKPCPSSPSSASSGTRAPSNCTVRVGCAFQPILRSLAPKETPGVSFGTSSADTPPGPSPPVRTMET